MAIDDFFWVTSEVAHVYYNQNDGFKFEAIRQFAEKAGIVNGMEKAESAIRLKPFLPEMTRWYYAYLQTLAKQNGVDLWIAFIPIPRDQSEVRADIEMQMSIARELGIKVIDITDTYSKAEKLDKLWVASWDRHPNVLGQQLLANRLKEKFRDSLFEAIEKK